MVEAEVARPLAKNRTGALIAKVLLGYTQLDTKTYDSGWKFVRIMIMQQNGTNKSGWLYNRDFPIWV